MSKRRIIPSIILAICLLFGTVFGLTANNTKSAKAAPVTSFSTTSTIAEQGDNNFYYCWGTVNNYVLMEYSVWGTSYRWIGPYEMYTYISANGTNCYIHPGIIWSSIVVWVADRAGTVNLSGTVARSKNVNGIEENGDGTMLTIAKRSGDTVEIMVERNITTTTSQTITNNGIEVAKGDKILIAGSSGPSKHQKNDMISANFTITYTTTAGSDYVEGEDLLKYVRPSKPCEVAGYKDLTGEYEAGQLAADETIDSDKTDVIIRGQSASSTEGGNDKGCSSSVESLLPVAIISIVGATLALCVKSRKRRAK